MRGHVGFLLCALQWCGLEQTAPSFQYHLLVIWIKSIFLHIAQSINLSLSWLSIHIVIHIYNMDLFCITKRFMQKKLTHEWNHGNFFSLALNSQFCRNSWGVLEKYWWSYRWATLKARHNSVLTANVCVCVVIWESLFWGVLRSGFERNMQIHKTSYWSVKVSWFKNEISYIKLVL